MDEKEKVLGTAMELIAGAGDSRCYCMDAIESAKQGKFQEAKTCIQNAVQAMVQTHEIQTELIRAEMEGNPLALSLLMVHAQDHLNLALIMRDIAEEFIVVYERLKELEDKESC